MTEQAYLNMLDHIMKNGTVKTDRTGTGTRSVFGHQLRFDLTKGFPLITTKRVHFKSVVVELLWFLSGSTNIKPLVDQDVHIWSDWPTKRFNQFITGEAGTDDQQELANEIAECNVEDGLWETINPTAREFGEFIKRSSKDVASIYGELGPVYGYQWRFWTKRPRDTNKLYFEGDKIPPYSPPYIDQIAQSIEMLKKSPDSRRNIVSAWNVADIDEMAVSGLPPCHFAFQWNTRPANLDQRLEYFMDRKGGPDSLTQLLNSSEHGPLVKTANLDSAQIADRYLDCHVNIRSWDTFLGGPFNIASYALLIHLYAEQVNMIPGELIISSGDTHIYSNHFEQVKTQLVRKPYQFPHLLPLPKRDSIFDYKPEDIQLFGYQSQDAIKAPIAV